MAPALDSWAMTKIIDVHNHFYPDEYLAMLDESVAEFSIGVDEEGRQVIMSEGSRIVTLTPQMTDLEARLEDMEETGVDHQVISLTAPNVSTTDPTLSVELAKTVNDAYARIQEDYSEFSALGSLPFVDVDAAVTEANRAINELGLHGFIVMTNVLGAPLNEARFRDLWEAIADLDAPIFLHPTTPAGVEVMGEYRLAPLVGFENELTMAVARLVFDGILERHDLTIHVSHLGGSLPYLVERLNNGYRAYPECREHIDQIPVEYLSQLYYDTVSFHLPALRCALETFGASQLLTGSDYPHVIGDLERAVTDIEALALTAAERRQIRGENAARIYDVQA